MSSLSKDINYRSATLLGTMIQITCTRGVNRVIVRMLTNMCAETINPFFEGDTNSQLWEEMYQCISMGPLPPISATYLCHLSLRLISPDQCSMIEGDTSIRILRSYDKQTKPCSWHPSNSCTTDIQPLIFLTIERGGSRCDPVLRGA